MKSVYGFYIFFLPKAFRGFPGKKAIRVGTIRLKYWAVYPHLKTRNVSIFLSENELPT